RRVWVEDVAGRGCRVRDPGGVLGREPLDFVDAGRVAAVRDPTRGILSLWQPSAHAGAEVMSGLGAFCSCELVSDDVERAKSFYGRAPRLAVPDRPERPDDDHERGSRIGVLQKRTSPKRRLRRGAGSPTSVPRAPKTRNRKPAHAAEGASPHPPQSGWRTALLADPQGATFAVLEAARNVVSVDG